jgi:tetratricopeptide (TPR) repeat protein
VTVQAPTFFDAQRILGRLLLDRAGTDRAKIDDALTHLQAALAQRPDDLPTGMAVAQILLSTNRTADAEKVLATMLERMPDQRGLNFTYAQVLSKLGRGDEGTKYLERAVEIDPTFSAAVFQLIDTYTKQENWARAAAVLEPLVAEDPANTDLQRREAYFYLRAGQPEKARATFKAVVAADPKDQRAQFFLAESLNDLEQYEEADRIYRTLLEKTPDDPDVLASYGLSLVGQKKYDQAAATFQHLMKVPEVTDSYSVLARTQLAMIELQRGNYGAAVSGVRDILVYRDKPNAQAINIAFDALKREKKYAEAIALLQPIVDKFGNEPFLNARYVEALLRAGDKKRAMDYAMTAAQRGPRNTVGAAEAFLQAEDYPSAIALLTNVVKTDSDVDVLYELASAYERSGDRAAAEKTFLQILEKNPNHAATLNYLGYMWAERGENLDRSAEMLTRAVGQEPNNGAYLDSLGWVYYQQGKLDLAEKYLTDAARLMPHDPTVHEHLGDVLLKRGQAQRALDMYKVALTLDPGAKDEAKIRSKIADVEKRATQR